MLELCSIASGSSGNCYFVGSDKTQILVDAGISCREITKRLQSIKKNPKDLQGIFVTHEHSDHISGVEVLSKKFDIPIYITQNTLENSRLNVENFTIIDADKQFSFNDLTINPFSKSHDAADPISFEIKNAKATASVITDIGYGCENVKKAIANSDALVIESNHDSFMLQGGAYPKQLKERILGNKGHLSNYEAALLVLEHASSKLKHVFLSHLSEENNKPHVALKTFCSIVLERKDFSDLNVMMTYKEKVSEVIKITS